MVFVGEEMRCGGLSAWSSSSEKKAAQWSLVPAKGGLRKGDDGSVVFVGAWKGGGRG